MIVFFSFFQILMNASPNSHVLMVVHVLIQLDHSTVGVMRAGQEPLVALVSELCTFACKKKKSVTAIQDHGSYSS